MVSSRPQRHTGPPIWLKDYIAASNLPGKSKYHITYDHLSPPYQSYLKAFSVVIEPKTYKEAATDKNWVNAIEHEIKALEDNHT